MFEVVVTFIVNILHKSHQVVAVKPLGISFCTHQTSTCLANVLHKLVCSGSPIRENDSLEHITDVKRMFLTRINLDKSGCVLLGQINLTLLDKRSAFRRTMKMMELLERPGRRTRLTATLKRLIRA